MQFVKVAQMLNFVKRISLQQLAKVCAAVIILSPLLYLLFSQEWLYTPLQSMDGYLDFGYSFFFDNGNFHMHTYKGARTPWLSIIFYLQKLTGPNFFSPILTVTFLLTVTSLYFYLIKTIFNIRTALLIIPWIVFFPHLFGIVTGGIAYNNTLAVCYFLTGLIFWTKRTLGHQRLLAFLAGFFVASAIFTNIVYLNLLLLFPVIDHHLKKQFKSKDYFAGAIAFTFSIPFWGLVNVLHNRKFLFFTNMMSYIKMYILNPSNQSVWWRGLGELGEHPAVSTTHLVFISAFFLTAIARLCLVKSFPKILTWHYAGLVLLWCLWHYTGQAALWPSDFSYPLQIPCILMIASWIPAANLSKKDIILALISAAFLWLCLYFSYPLKSLVDIGSGKANIVLAAVATVALIFIFAARRVKYANIASFVLLGFVFSAINFEPRSTAGFNCSVRKQSYNSQMHISENLMAITPGPSRFYFFVGPVKDKNLADRTCLYDNVIPLKEIPRNIMFMLGYDLGEYDYTNSRSKEISALNSADFENFHGYLVLFPFNTENFSADFLAKARALGFNLQKTHSFVENVMGEPVPYEVYRQE